MPHSQLAALYRLILLLAIAIGFGLRLHLLGRFALREDEAIYSYWALHWLRDPLFLTVWPDKPPLFLWLLAGAFRFLGNQAASGQFLNILLSTLTIPVVAMTAQQLWGWRAALAVALTYALNPFAISFAPTVYTDPLLVFAGSLACYLACSRRTLWCGLWLGVAMMTKQQGMFYIPLVLGYGMRSAEYGIRNIAPTPFRIPRPEGTRAFRILLGVAIVVAPILYWDSLRWAVAPSPWDLSVRNYGPLALAALSEWPARLLVWSRLAWYLAASWPAWVVICLCYFRFWGFFGMQWVDRQNRPNNPGISEDSGIVEQRKPIPWALIAWAMAFLVLHTVTTIPAWDRYLLPLAAVFALLVGWLVSRVLTGKMVWVILLLWSLLLLPPAVQAATGQLPIGGDHGAYSGLSEALAWVQQVPGQRVLYQRNLSWQTNFYLYNELYAEKGRRTLTVRWISNSVALVDNVHNNPVGRKFVLLPTWSPLLDLPRFAQMQGVIVYTHRRFGNFSLYELQTRPRPYCNWCRCVEKKHWLTVLPFARGKRGFN